MVIVLFHFGLRGGEAFLNFIVYFGILLIHKYLSVMGT